MAKVVGPLFSVEARGSIGALTFNSFRGISTVKGRCPKAPRDSPAQIETRRLAALATAYWKTMTLPQCDVWNDYAASMPEKDWTGQAKHISGYNWFIRINVRRQRCSASIDAALPQNQITEALSVTSVISEYDGISIAWSVSPDDFLSPAYLDIRMGGAHSPGRKLRLPETNFTALPEVHESPWFFSAVEYGWYTFYIRLMSESGVVGPWVRTIGEAVVA